MFPGANDTFLSRSMHYVAKVTNVTGAPRLPESVQQFGAYEEVGLDSYRSAVVAALSD